MADASTRAKEIFDQANEVVGFDLARICFEGPAEELGRTDIQQPAIFTTSVAIWAAFVEAGGSREHFARMGGLSLGEYTALHLAGALTFEDALRLVQRRGELMQRAAVAVPSSMASLIGADAAAAQALCDRARGDDVLGPANFNCPGQIVISGTKEACERAVALAGEFGCRAVALAVAGAFHSPLMEPAAAQLWATLEQTAFKEPDIPVIANVDCEYHRDAAGLRESLKRQLTQPVLWQRCMERLIEEGVDRFVEIGPGRALTGMMRKINRKVEAVNLSKAESLGSVAAPPKVG